MLPAKITFLHFFDLMSFKISFYKGNSLLIQINYILLALLISNKATAIDIKTGVQAAIKGFKIPFTPRELEKKDKI